MFNNYCVLLVHTRNLFNNIFIISSLTGRSHSENASANILICLLNEYETLGDLYMSALRFDLRTHNKQTIKCKVPHDWVFSSFSYAYIEDIQQQQHLKCAHIKLRQFNIKNNSQVLTAEKPVQVTPLFAHAEI